MTIRRVISPDVPEPPPERWSNCLVSDGIAYVAGMTSRGTDAATLAKMDEYDQAKQIFGTGDPGRDRGDRPHRQGRALTSSVRASPLESRAHGR
jgi:hypothetical protein